MEATIDPNIFIEERRPGYIRYCQEGGRRWEVFGECVGLGYCMVGAVVEDRELKTLDEALEYMKINPLAIDSPITPEFHGCCSFTYKEIEC